MALLPIRRTSKSPDSNEGLTLEIRISNYEPLLRVGKYPEVKQALRVWHPAFEDAHTFTYEELHPARVGKEAILYVPFRKFRKGIRPANTQIPIMLHASSILGLDLYAATANKQGQKGIKPNGSYTNFLLSTLQDHKTSSRTNTVTHTNIEFISAHLRAELTTGDKNQHLASKARIGKFSVTVIESSHYYNFETGEKDSVTTELDNTVTSIRTFIVDKYQMYFRRRTPMVAKMQDYYSLRYVIAPGVYVPSSGYIIRMTSPQIPEISNDTIYRMFTASLHGHPEIKDEKMWLSVVKTFLSSTLQYPEKTPGDWSIYVHDPKKLKDVFMDCLKVAMDILVLFSTSVPYLVDMEWRGERVPGHRETESQDMQEVERFWPATQTYGHDCEDSGVHADFMKHTIAAMRTKSNLEQASELSHPIIYILSQVYKLFNSCVMQMFCSGNDRQIVKDDGIFHYACYCIPRLYMYDCEMRGYNDGGIWTYEPEKPTNVKAWEEDYREYLGAFILEGTNTTDSAQFKYSSLQNNIRKQIAAEAYNARKRMTKTVVETVNMLHSEIYAGDSHTLSAFYKYAISCFRGDSPIHRKERVFDYVWYDSNRGGRTGWGVRVEALSNMENYVAISPIMKYDEQIYNNTIQLIDTYCQLYTPLDSDPVESFSSPPETMKFREIEENPILQTFLNKPLFNDEYINRAHYLRFHPLEVDMKDPNRKKAFINDLVNIVKDNNMNVISIRYFCDHIANLPLDPITMKRGGKLTRIIVLVFFRQGNNLLLRSSVSEHETGIVDQSRGQYV